MDFAELEAVEGLRWSWNSWPITRAEANALVVPLSIMYTPLHQVDGLPQLPYDPLLCSSCGAILNPYATVVYQHGLWSCSFCLGKNYFPRSYAGINETNLPTELFPTHSIVEYHLGKKGLNLNQNPGLNSVPGFQNGSISKVGSFPGSSSSLSGLDRPGRVVGPGPAFVFVMDAYTEEEELRVLKSELLHVIARLPENALVGLVVFDSMVRVYDLGFSEGLRVVLFHGERKVSAEKTKELLGIYQSKRHHGGTSTVKKQGFLLPVSECEFSLTSAIEELYSSTHNVPGARPLRCTGVAISAALGLLEGCSVNTASRIMVFTSGPATIGPGLIVDSDFSHAIRTHRDIESGRAPYYQTSSEFYQELSQRLCDSSVVVDLFACSLDQVGAAELKVPVESSGGYMILAESFDSEQFRKCLHNIFIRDEEGNLKMCFDATIELVTTKGVKICGALGPCVSLQKNSSSVSNNKIGEGGTCMWKLGTLNNKTCIAFLFEVDDGQKIKPNTVFLVQFITRYRYGNMGIRKRVTTVARRMVGNRSPEIAAGFDQEAAASVIARLAIDKVKINFPRDVITWLDSRLVTFVAKFGDYIQEDPSTFRLSTNFSLYPQFMYHLRRSQFLDVFNSTPDETAFFWLMLNREGVVSSLLMIQPTLLQYSFEGPPCPVLLDVRSICPDVILLFDSYFHVVIHYGSKIAQWRKLGYDRDPSNESLRKLLEAVQFDAQQLVAERIPVPKLIKCDQHGSQARFLLVKLNPSVTHDTMYADGSEVIFTEDVSLQVFMEHLQCLAVQQG